MWRPRVPFQVDSAVGSAGLALVCSTLAQYFFTWEAEIYSEILCWVTLPALFIFTEKWDKWTLSKWTIVYSDGKPASSWSLWVVAFFLALQSLGKSQYGILVLFPMLTPLLLMVQRYLQLESTTLDTHRPWYTFSLVNSIFVSCLAATWGMLALAEWDLRAVVPSILPTLALGLVYCSFLPPTSRTPRLLPCVDVIPDLFHFAPRVGIAMCCPLAIQISLYGLVECNIASMLALSLFKILSWYFTIRTAQQSSWIVATTIGTFSLTTAISPWAHFVEFHALAPVLSALFSLAQSIQLIPSNQNPKSRHILWILACLPLVPYLSALWTISNATSLSAKSFTHASPARHPIEILHNEAKASFEKRLTSQSKDYNATVTEYRRRYNTEPPPGFAEWYDFATSIESPLIDDFDMIYQAVSPFRRMSGSEVQDIMDRVYEAPDSDVWMCVISGKKGEEKRVHCKHPHKGFDRHISNGFKAMLKDVGKLAATIPEEVRFLVNHLDEPRVLIPPQEVDDKDFSTQPFTQTDLTHKRTWTNLTQYCRHSSHPSTLPRYENPLSAISEVHLVISPTDATNLCRKPSLQNQHALFASPSSLRLITGLVPILTTGIPSTMGGIPFPSPAYNESEFLYDPSEDIPFAQKHPSLYWAGSSTGGYAHDTTNWRTFHRQRFVDFANGNGAWKRDGYTYLASSPDPNDAKAITSYTSNVLNPRLYNVHFTRISQCTPPQCLHQRAHFRPRPHDPPSAAFAHTLLFDTDGNGISGRFYKLLASRSAVLKQTLLREWHDERLVPWLHYVPVGFGMGEVGEVVRFLAGTERGRGVAEGVAGEGAEWIGRGLRGVDRSAYLFRLVLELGRVGDRGREAGE